MSINKKIPIYLNVYNFSKINNCLGPIGCGIYHTGVQINETEFCYSVIDFEPQQTGVLMMEPETARYIFSHKMFIAQTQKSPKQIQTILTKLSKKYKCGTYHAFNMNCNHFSSELIQQLTNKKIESYFFRMTNCLNYLCCCLPQGMVSGQWALQALYDDLQEETQTKEKN